MVQTSWLLASGTFKLRVHLALGRCNTRLRGQQQVDVSKGFPTIDQRLAGVKARSADGRGEITFSPVTHHTIRPKLVKGFVGERLSVVLEAPESLLFCLP